MTTKPAMATEIPASILTPDSVETQLGTLRFFDGFPDEATVERVYDNLDFQRGVQAFLAALPAAASMPAYRLIRAFGPHNRTVLIAESLLDSPRWSSRRIPKPSTSGSGSIRRMAPWSSKCRRTARHVSTTPGAAS